MEKSFGKILKQPTAKKLLPYLVLAVLLALSFFAWQYYEQALLEREARRYNGLVNRIADEIVDQLHKFEMILLGGAGIFVASEEVTREEWRAYSEYQQVNTHYPGIHRITVSRVVQPAELAQHIEEIRAEGFPDYTVWPEGEREVFVPVIYLEPFDDLSRRAFGYDIFSEPARRSAMEQARDTGSVAITSKVILITAIDQDSQPGFIMFVPIYAQGMPTNTPAERKAAIEGYVAGAFLLQELMQGLFPVSINEISFQIYDGAETSPETLLYENHITPDDYSTGREPLFASQQNLDLYNHQLTLTFETMPPFEAAFDRVTPKGILASGLLVSFLIFFYLRTLQTTGDRALSLAREMTITLRESEEKYRFLAENITDVIWTIDLVGNFTYISPAIEELIGFTPEEVMAMAINDFVVQEDYDAMMALLSEELAKSPAERERFVSIQARHRTKDNHFVHAELNVSWILDEQGNAAGLQGTTRDITARKLAEDEVRTQRDELDTLYTFSTKMRTAKKTEDLFAYILREACRLLQANAGMVTFLSPDKTRYTIANGTGSFAESIGLSFPVEQGLSGQVLQTEKPVTCENYGAKHRALPLNNIDKLGPAALVPLQSEEALVGVLAISRSRESSTLPFTPAEVKTLAALGEIAGNALRRQFLFESAQKRLSQIQALRNIDMAITGSLDLRITFSVILNEITGLLKTDASAIIRIEPLTGSLKYEAWRGFSHLSPAELNLRLGEGFAGRAAMNRKPIHISDLKDAEVDRVQGSLLEREGFIAYYAVPLIAKGQVHGVLEIYHREPFHLDGEWLEFLEVIAGQTAIAIDSTELFHNMECTNYELIQAYDATIEGWSYALDLKDEETENHSKRVTETTLTIARKMNIKDEQLAHVRRGALLHDIGKMGIPDAILLNPGKLTDEEWVVMRKHPVYAHDMLAPIDYLRPALDIPYCHHEKWDGTGYPRGLKGTAIPLAARIFAVVDVYDALISDRPYRKAWSKQEALSHIREESGKHFDPEVVEVFMRITENETT